MKEEINFCGKIYKDKVGNKGAVCANSLPCNSNHMIDVKNELNEHDFFLSSIVSENDPSTTSAFYKQIGYVVCRKCGEIRKQEV